MQELSLYALIPARRVKQLLRTFSGLCNMSPQPQFTHHLLFKPKRPYRPNVVIGGSGQGELYHLQLVTHIDEERWEEEHTQAQKEKQEEQGKEKEKTDDVVMIDLDAEASEKESKEKLIYDLNAQKWSIKLLDYPEATRRSSTSRLIVQSEITEGDAIEFMDSLGYSYVSEYVLSGHLLVYNTNIVITLTQTFLPTIPLPSPPTIKPTSLAVTGPSSPLPRSSLKHLDPAESYVCQVSVRVAHSSDLESMELAQTELKKFQELIRGVVELEPADRLTMDTRVK